MKNYSKIFALISLLGAYPLFAQSIASSLPSNSTTNIGTSQEPLSVIARSANERKWGRVSLTTNNDGSLTTNVTRSYTELATGICTYSTESNIWTDSDPVIDILATGAVANGTRHKVSFNGNVAAPDGAVKLRDPDGNNFVAAVYGLAYYDTATGKSALLGSIQSTPGVVIGDSEVVYSNAFSGSVTADLEYWNKLAGLEQNVVIRSSLPVPESFGDLNNKTTLLEVWTEMLSSPEPQSLDMTSGGQPDSVTLDFGAMKIGPGEAFRTPQESESADAGLGFHVLKQWVHQNGRTFLVEQVPYEVISNSVQNLPPHASITQPGFGTIKNTASLFPLRPRTAVTPKSNKMIAAKTSGTSPGLVVDWTLSTSGTNYDFDGGTTYFVTGTVDLAGSNNIFEGGTVLKFTNATSANIYMYQPNGNLVFNGSNWRPSVFTSMNDNTVGDAISGSTGVPSMSSAYYVISAATNMSVSHARFSYGGVGVDYFGGYYTSNGVITVRHCQFLDCSIGVYLTYVESNSLYMQNVLAAGCTRVIRGGTAGSGLTLYGENLTIDQWGNFSPGVTGGSIINSILTGTGAMTSPISFYNTISNSSGSGIYQTVGNGYYYLANSSTNRGAGTTNIDAQTLEDLQSLTTYPPTVFSNSTIAVSTNWGIAAPRDPCTNGVDLGYHYDPLDYVFAGTKFGSNVTFLPGTAVGWFDSGPGYGVYLSNYVTANFTGTAETPTWWVRANTSQEQGYGGPWTGLSGFTYGGIVGNDNQYNYNVVPSPIVNLFFAKCSILGEGDGAAMNHFRDDVGYLTINGQDSEFYGGCIGAYILVGNFTNCLFDSTVVSEIAGWSNIDLVMRACTMHNGGLNLNPYLVPMTISIRDSAFDGTAISTTSYGANTNNADYSYNAFTNASSGFSVGGAHDVILTNGFNWQTSWFGSFYLPTNSLALGVGDLPAYDFGLYYYTTQTNQTIQGTNIVDMAYHYVATDGDGFPLESVIDGLPLYLSDAMSRGLLNGVAIDWILDPYTGLSAGNGLEVFTPLQ